LASLAANAACEKFRWKFFFGPMSLIGTPYSAGPVRPGDRQSYPFGLEPAFSWRPCLAHNFGRRFGSLAAPFLGFLDTDDSTSAKLHRARRQSGLLQLIEKREANTNGGAEFLD
jgi:hypothetical protein